MKMRKHEQYPLWHSLNTMIRGDNVLQSFLMEKYRPWLAGALWASLLFAGPAIADNKVGTYKQNDAGNLVASGGPVTLTSYDPGEDPRVVFGDVLKLNGSGLFGPSEVDEVEEGIYGVIGKDGWIELKVYAFGDSMEEYLIYHVRLEQSSSDEYSTGVPRAVSVNIYDEDGSSSTHVVKGTDIKRLLQGVRNAHTLTKSDYRNWLKLDLAHDEVHRRRREAGTDAGDAAGPQSYRATIIKHTDPQSVFVMRSAAGAAEASTAVEEGKSVPLVGALLAAGQATLGDTRAPDPNDWSNGTEVERWLLEDFAVASADSVGTVNYYELPDAARLVAAGSYPVKVQLSLSNAEFHSAKVPGLPELTPGLFMTWDTQLPTSRHVRDIGSVWKEGAAAILSQSGKGLSQKTGDRSFIQSSDYRDYPVLRVTVNPAAGGGEGHHGSHAYAPDAHTTGTPEPLVLSLGDHLVIEVVAPIPKGVNIDVGKGDDYPDFSSFPYAWMAFFGGEVLFMEESSIAPGDWRPFLGYDSQVHGTVLRPYPTGFMPKYDHWEVVRKENHVTYRTFARITRLMDPELAHDHHAPPKPYWPKQKTTPVKQRNNQREGLNMELLRAWTAGGNYRSYTGKRYLPGLDADELIYLRSSRGEGDSISVNSIIASDTSEEWKKVPDKELANPIDDILRIYRKNRRSYIGASPGPAKGTSADYYPRVNREILDKATSAAYPNGNGTGNVYGSGQVRLWIPQKTQQGGSSSGSIIKFPVHSYVPLNEHLGKNEEAGFYAHITGPGYPVVGEKGLVYIIKNLTHDKKNNYAVSFDYENSAGEHSHYTAYSKDASDKEWTTPLEGQPNSAFWHVTLPEMNGYGYYGISLWYKNAQFAGESWVRIAGKELLDINLRFVSVPGDNYSTGGRPYIGLQEGVGDGAGIWLDGYADSQHYDYNTRKFSRYSKDYTHQYVVHAGDALRFQVMDADPHTFYHEGTEWYLSARTQAKRLRGAALNQQLSLTMYKKAREGWNKFKETKLTEANIMKLSVTEGTCRSEPGCKLQFRYRGANPVTHYLYNIGSREKNEKVQIHTRTLSDLQKGWLKAAGVTLGDQEWNTHKVGNILSRHRYVTGPRVHTDKRQINRFHPGNDYADSYIWKYDNKPYANLGSDYLPSGMMSAIRSWKAGKDWLPRAYVRHASETDTNGKVGPQDLLDSGITVTKFSEMTDTQKGRFEAMFEYSMEPWQIRLPWLSHVFDPSPYNAGKMFTDYRARTNIKAIYDMKKFFDNDHGAFSGNPFPRKGSILNKLMTDDVKFRRFFMNDLATGRMIVLPASIYKNNFFSHIQVTNTKTPDQAQW